MVGRHMIKRCEEASASQRIVVENNVVHVQTKTHQEPMLQERKACAENATNSKAVKKIPIVAFNYFAGA